MLQNIRDNIQGTMAKIIIGIIIVPFALFGIDSLIGGSGVVNVANVNGEKITDAELQREIYLQKRRILTEMSDQVDPSILDDAFLRGPALQSLIERNLVTQLADDESIRVSATMLDQEIINMKQFQNNGQFSPEIYQNVLRNNGYTLAYFKQLVNNGLLMSQVSRGVAGSDFVTGQELEDAIRVLSEQRSFRYLLLPIENYMAKVNVDEKLIKDYYSEQINEFQNPERLKIDYIEVKQQDFVQSLTEDELRETYELEMASFESSVTRRASHILLEVTDTRNEKQAILEAKKLLQQLAEGKDFAVLAKTVSEDTVSAIDGGDLGFTSGDTFPVVFEEVLSVLLLNEVSQPVVTDAGVHLIKATETQSTAAPSFDEYKPGLKQRLELSNAQTRFLNTIEQLRDQVFNAEDLNGPAAELGVTVNQSDWVSRDTLSGVLSNKQVVVAAYSSDVLQDRNNSEVLELAKDHFIVVRVNDYKAAEAKPLTDVTELIVNTLKKEQATTQALEHANQVISKLSTSSFEEIAKEENLEWQLLLDAERTNNSINRDLLSGVFLMPVVDGKPYLDKVKLPNGNVAVVQLDEVKDGQVSKVEMVKQNSILQQMKDIFIEQNMKGYMQSVRQNADIDIL